MDTIVWIVDNRIEWSNLVYLEVSRVLRINQLQRIVFDDDTIIDTSLVDVRIINKNNSLVTNKKTKNREFDIDAEFNNYTEATTKNHCASCIMPLQYSDKDLRQFTVDRKTNSLGYVRNNVMLTCLEFNRRNGAS